MLIKKTVTRRKVLIIPRRQLDIPPPCQALFMNSQATYPRPQVKSSLTAPPDDPPMAIALLEAR
jgi:hypothetical protein